MDNKIYEVRLCEEDENYFYFELPIELQKLCIEKNYKKCYITFMEGEINEKQ